MHLYEPAALAQQPHGEAPPSLPDTRLCIGKPQRPATLQSRADLRNATHVRLSLLHPRTTRRVVGLKCVVRGFSFGRPGQRRSSQASTAPSATQGKFRPEAPSAPASARVSMAIGFVCHERTISNGSTSARSSVR
jgi:hypothetical protein